MPRGREARTASALVAAMEWSDGHGGREGEDGSGLREEDVGGGHGGKEGAGPQ